MLVVGQESAAEEVIDTMTDCLIKKARRMVGVCEGKYVRCSLRDEPLTLKRSHSSIEFLKS